MDADKEVAWEALEAIVKEDMLCEDPKYTELVVTAQGNGYDNKPYSHATTLIRCTPK